MIPVIFLPTWFFRVGDRDVTCIPVLHLECRRAQSDNVCGPRRARGLGHVALASAKLDKYRAGSFLRSSLRFG